MSVEFFPKINAWPLSWSIWPVKILIVVVFPEPDGPRNPKMSPSFTLKLTFDSAFFSLNYFVIFLNLIIIM